MDHDIFLSWNRKDRALAEKVKRALERPGWRVFWSPLIPGGDRWEASLKRKLDAAGCVVVLWTEDSSNSFWVTAEAAAAAAKEKLLSVRTSRSARVPSLFEQYQIFDLSGWDRKPQSRLATRLGQSVARILGEMKVDQGWFDAPKNSGEEITAEDITLVHTTWRATEHDPKLKRYGELAYRVHVILHGHPSVLNRVKKVTYYFEGWPKRLQYKPGGSRTRNFEVNELAWGDFVVRANVSFRSEKQKDIGLSRFVNLASEGPRLDRFMQLQRRMRRKR